MATGMHWGAHMCASVCVWPRGCNDYVAWSQVLGRLAAQFTGVVAVNVDDFCPGRCVDGSSRVAHGWSHLCANVRVFVGSGNVAGPPYVNVA